jgi:predicted nuclease of predicted toxin-antitoxin system
MKILLDMNLSPLWREVLQAEGWEAVHWSEVGDPRATDRVIMNWAGANGYVVFTHDLDFGALLAATQALGPSVIQARTQDVMPDAIGSLVIRVLRDCAEALNEGALVVIQEGRSRVRILPLRKL